MIQRDMQKLLLENEGVEVGFTPDGWQVDLKKDGWPQYAGRSIALSGNI